jgi:branched-chain amino acid transport system substrate-binding protein
MKFTSLGLGAALLALSSAAQAQTKDPIRIGVIAEAQAVAGSSIPLAAQLAADEINAAGGVDGPKSRSFPTTTTPPRPNRSVPFNAP